MNLLPLVFDTKRNAILTISLRGQSKECMNKRSSGN